MSWRYAAHAANENFPSDAVSELEAAGHDIVWVRNAAPGSKDEDYWHGPCEKLLPPAHLSFYYHLQTAEIFCRTKSSSGI